MDQETRVGPEEFGSSRDEVWDKGKAGMEAARRTGQWDQTEVAPELGIPFEISFNLSYIYDQVGQPECEYLLLWSFPIKGECNTSTKRGPKKNQRMYFGRASLQGRANVPAVTVRVAFHFQAQN